jgi:hypothetical protein
LINKKNQFYLDYTYIFGVFSQSCYTTDNIIQSSSLFSYKGNIYDMSSFIHPKNVNINKLIGKDLETFVNENSLSFH